MKPPIFVRTLSNDERTRLEAGLLALAAYNAFHNKRSRRSRALIACKPQQRQRT
jgi:hypothetical protein